MMRSHRELAAVACVAGLSGMLLAARSAEPAHAFAVPGAPRQLEAGGCLTDQRTDQRIGCARIRAFRGPGGKVSSAPMGGLRMSVGAMRSSPSGAVMRPDG